MPEPLLATANLKDILQPPASSGVIREARGLIELPRLLLGFPRLARQPRGNGEAILVLPGYGAGDGSTVLLKTYLRVLGYSAHGWRMGRNSGNVPGLLPRLLKRLASMARRCNSNVTIIGWSMGGYFARELARERPDLVRRVITLGTPVIGGPKYTVVAHSYRRHGVDVEAMAAEVDARNQVSLLIPVTAIYSRADNIVAWRACIDTATRNIEHVEVRTTHLGFGFSPDVYQIIAQRLAQDAPLSAPPTKTRRSRRPLHRRQVNERR